MTPRHLLLCLLAIFAVNSQTSAQTPKVPTPAPATAPVIQSVRPSGITLGEETVWTVTGQGLAKCDSVLFSGQGLEVVEIKPKDETSVAITVRASPLAQPGFQDLRMVGADGISNLRTIRVDTLKQVDEREPNDDPAKALEVEPGVAVIGVLPARDVDHVRLKAKRGDRLTIEVEAQRLGTAISPVVSVMAENGASLVQARESRGTERDSRVSFLAPDDATYIVQVRDNIYSGSDSATYRLRIEALPYATTVFPLGGTPGQALTLNASGGSMQGARSKTIQLPNVAGMLIDVGAFDGPGGPIVVPGKIVVNDGQEVIEIEGGPTPLPQTATVNGRISRPGEVDRYTIPVKKGDQLRLKIRAADLGSWLDSVLAIVDEKGTILAENDEPTTNANRGNGTFFGLNTDSPDSVLDYEAKEDGALLVDVTDRYGDGGPEFVYRLSAIAAKPDFDVNLLIGANVAAGQGAVRPVVGPGASGVYNLKPGSSTPINFLINGQGRPGAVRVEIEGLPPGITAQGVEIKLDGPITTTQPPKVGAARPAQVQSLGGAIVLKVDPQAEPGLVGEFRIVATTLKHEVPFQRHGSATIAVNTQPGSAGTRTPSRTFSSFLVKITGTKIVRLVGPVFPYRLNSVVIPGVLTPGGQLNLNLEFEPKLDPSSSIEVTASAEETHLSVKTLPASPASTGEPQGRKLQVQVSAGVAAIPGVRDIKLTCKVGEYDPQTYLVSVIVRPLFTIRATRNDLELAPGQTVRIPLAIERSSNYDGPIEFKTPELPAGIQLANKLDVAKGTTFGFLEFTVPKETKVVGRTDTVRVVAVATLAEGIVETKISIPLKITGPDTDHKDEP